jgi:glycosyltransferase involved in cell wall biosynthesis
VLLVTSHTESFCLAALEAATCGLATVAPRVGGVAEVVIDGTTGVLFEPGDVDGAARAIVALLSDPAALARMREAAVHHAAAFAPDRLVPRYETCTAL